MVCLIRTTSPTPATRYLKKKHLPVVTGETAIPTVPTGSLRALLDLLVLREGRFNLLTLHVFRLCFSQYVPVMFFHFDTR